MHGFAKDEAREALAAPGKRRVRGKVAQSLFAAFLLAAVSIRKIRSFLANADTDERGVRYVTRPPRKSDHARTGLRRGSARPTRAAAQPQSSKSGAQANRSPENRSLGMP